MNYYKYLSVDGSTPQGYGHWPLPKDGKPGAWLPKLTGKLVPCVHGYHVLRTEDILDWDGPMLIRVEVKGKVLESDNKCVVREARAVSIVEGWNERTQRLFAADCAERVLPLFEKRFPDDRRPRAAIEAMRAYAQGEITKVKLAAGGDAAWAAARDAAGDAARAAGGDAAWTAARDAARDAAWAAARAVAWDAAWAAARATANYAASAAAWAATSAWAATWTATSNAARGAARAAERAWQTERLKQYLDGKLQ